MPILGGHRSHEDDDGKSIDKKGLHRTYKRYLLENNIALQMKKIKTFKGKKFKELSSHKNVEQIKHVGGVYYKKVKESSFLKKFESVFSKWMTKESVEVD